MCDCISVKTFLHGHGGGDMVSVRSVRLAIPLLPLCVALAAPLGAQSVSCTDSPKAILKLEYRQAEIDRRALPAAAKRVPPDAEFPEAVETFQALVSDSTVTELHLPFHWRLSLLETGEVNAFSIPDGEVLVSRPLADRLGHNRGLWAAVLAHEISHIAGRHWFKRYCHSEEAQPHAQALPGAGDDIILSSSLSLVQSSEGFVFSRAQELEADRQGMLLMAHAGYHPDFFFALNHLLKALPQQDSRNFRYASTHPGWEERDHAGRDQSIQADWVFEERWPEGSHPPGGNPPMVVFLSEPGVTGGQAVVDVQCRNPDGPLEVVFLAWDSKPSGGKSPEAKMSEVRSLSCTPMEEIAIPLDGRAEALRSRKLEARFVVLSVDHTVLEYSRSFGLKIPR